jgi:phytoene dehydrogenase-like protein
MRIIGLNIADEVEDNLDNDILKGLISHEAILGSNLGPRSPGSVLHLMYKQAIQSGNLFTNTKIKTTNLLNSLENLLKEEKVEILLNTKVKNLQIKNNKVSKVFLENGKEFTAETIISNLDPKSTFFNLIGAQKLETDQIRRVKNYRQKGNVANVVISLENEPIIKKYKGDILNSTFVFSPSINFLEHAFNDSKYNRNSKNPSIKFNITKKEEKFFIRANIQYIPFSLEKKEAIEKEDVIKNIINQLNQFFDKLEIKEIQINTPNDIQEDIGTYGGHWHHGECEIDQVFFLRPFYGFTQYNGSIKNLYMCGAGTHPGGGINGINGHNTAKKIIEDQK